MSSRLKFDITSGHLQQISVLTEFSLVSGDKVQEVLTF